MVASIAAIQAAMASEVVASDYLISYAVMGGR